jgi:hypothetical protein
MQTVDSRNESDHDRGFMNTNLPDEEDRRMVYQQLCTSYHAIDDFRTKLLGFLPLATGTGIFLVLNDMSAARMAELKVEFGVVGLFGFLITLGLFAFELYGIKKCHALIVAGKDIEHMLGVDGHFARRPREFARVVNEPFASGIIYPAVLAAWTYIGVFNVSRSLGGVMAGLVFSLGFLLSLLYNVQMGRAPTTIVPPSRNQTVEYAGVPRAEGTR